MPTDYKKNLPNTLFTGGTSTGTQPAKSSRLSHYRRMYPEYDYLSDNEIAAAYRRKHPANAKLTNDQIWGALENKYGPPRYKSNVWEAFDRYAKSDPRVKSNPNMDTPAQRTAKLQGAMTPMVQKKGQSATWDDVIADEERKLKEYTYWKMVKEKGKEAANRAVTMDATLVRSIPSVVSAIGSLPPGYIPGVSMYTGNTAKNFREKVIKSKFIKDVDKEAVNYAQKVESSRPQLEADIPVDYQRSATSIKEVATDPKRLIGGAIANAPQMAASLVLGRFAPQLAMPFMYGLEAGDMAEGVEEYEKKTGKKVDIETKNALVFTGGAINALLEKIGIDSILKASKVPGIRSKVYNAIMSFLTESSTESLQEVTNILVEHGYDKEAAALKDQLPRIFESGAIGGIYGLGGGSIKGGIELTNETKISNAAGNIANKVGLSPEETKKFQKYVLNEVIKKGRKFTDVLKEYASTRTAQTDNRRIREGMGRLSQAEKFTKENPNYETLVRQRTGLSPEDARKSRNVTNKEINDFLDTEIENDAALKQAVNDYIETAIDTDNQNAAAAAINEYLDAESNKIYSAYGIDVTDRAKAIDQLLANEEYQRESPGAYERLKAQYRQLQEQAADRIISAGGKDVTDQAAAIERGLQEQDYRRKSPGAYNQLKQDLKKKQAETVQESKTQGKKTLAERIAFYEQELKRNDLPKATRARYERSLANIQSKTEIPTTTTPESVASSKEPTATKETPKKKVAEKPLKQEKRNPYLTMPIDRVKQDAANGVKLAKEALKSRETKDVSRETGASTVQKSSTVEKPVRSKPEPTTQPAVSESQKKPWEMTPEEYEYSKRSEIFGDLFATPDGKMGIMRSGGGLGSNRVKLYDVNNKFIGYYNRNELKILRKMSVDYTADKKADEWAEKVTKGISELKKKHSKLLLSKGIYDRFKRAVKEGEITKEHFLEKQKDNSIISDKEYAKAVEVEKQIDAIRETPLPDMTNKEHEKIIEKALSEGKTPYEGWEKDYPDLQKQGSERSQTPKAKTVPTAPPAQTKGAETPETVDTSTEAVQEIIDGKRESTIGTKEFKKRMIAELDKAMEKAEDVPHLEYHKKSQKARTEIEKAVGKRDKITIEIPGDGTFKIPNIKQTLEHIKKKVQSLPLDEPTKKQKQIRKELKEKSAPKTTPTSQEKAAPKTQTRSTGLETGGNELDLLQEIESEVREQGLKIGQKTGQKIQRFLERIHSSKNLAELQELAHYAEKHFPFEGTKYNAELKRIRQDIQNRRDHLLRHPEKAEVTKGTETPGQYIDFIDKDQKQRTGKFVRKIRSGKKKGYYVIEYAGSKKTIAPEMVKTVDIDASITTKPVTKSDKKHAEIQQRVNTIQGRAKNAARTTVVRTFDDLPEGIKLKYLSLYGSKVKNKLGGVFVTNATTGAREVFLISDNLPSVDHAVITWFHEQVGHHGLKELYGDEFNDMLDTVIAEVGIKQIKQVVPEAYHDLSDQTLAAEYLAKVAEKIAYQQQLTDVEQSIWKKFLTWLKGVLDIRSADRMEEIVLRSYRHIFTESGTESKSDSDVLFSIIDDNGTPRRVVSRKRNMGENQNSLRNPIRLEEIGQRMLESFGLETGTSVRVGKSVLRRFHKKARGLYFPNSGIIRVFNINQVKTLAHEIGHKLDDELFNFQDHAIYKKADAPVNMALGIKNEARRKRLMETYRRKYGNSVVDDIIRRAELRRELKKMGYNKTTSEGVADFISYYVTDPAKAQKEAPKFYALFESIIAKQPKFRDALLQTRERFKEYNEQDDRLKYESKIHRESPENKFLAALNKIEDNWYVSLVDGLNNIRDITTQLEKLDKNLTGDKSPIQQVLSTLGIAGKVDQAIYHHPFLRRGNEIKILTDVKPLIGTKKKPGILFDVLNRGILPEVEHYLLALRDLELHKRALHKAALFSEKIAKNTIALAEKKFGADYLHQIHEDLQAYNEALLRYYYESGKLSKEQFNAILEMNQYYVPFYRYLDEILSTGKVPTLTTMLKPTSPSPVKKIRGDDEAKPVMPPIASIVKNTYDYMVAADRNIALRTFIDAIEKIGKADGQPLVQEIPTRHFKPVNVIAKPTMVIDPETGTPKMVKPNQFTETRVGVFYEPPANKRIITVWDDGKARYYEIAKEYYDAIFTINEPLSQWVKVLAVPSRILRAGAVVYDPTFTIRNISRDQLLATFRSKYGYNPFGFDFARGVFAAIKKNEMYQRYLASGADQAFLLAMDEVTTPGGMDKLMRKQKMTGRAMHYLRRPFAFLSDLNRMSEMGTRMGSFEKAFNKSGDVYKAMQESREITADYSNKGSLMRNVSPIYAFLNARIQIVRNMAQTAKKRPGHFTAMGTIYVTIPSLILWAWNHQDDEAAELYANLPYWRKVGFFNIYVPGARTFVPIPRGTLGIIFGASVENVLDHMLYQEAIPAKKIVEEFFKETSPITNWNGLFPTAATPIMEQAFNKVGFTGRNIVPEYMKNYDPKYQYTNSTPEIIKGIGRMLNVSPRRLEHLITSITAGAGRGVINILDYVAQEVGLVEKKPETTFVKLSRLPVLRAVIVPTPIGTRSRQVYDFYAMLDKMVGTSATVNKLIVDGNVDALDDYLGDEETKKMYQYYGNKYNRKVISDFKKILSYSALILQEQGKNKQGITAIEYAITDIARKIQKAYDDNRTMDRDYIFNALFVKAKVLEVNKRVKRNQARMKLKNN